MLFLFFAPIAVLIFVPFNSILLLFALYIIAGFGAAGIGMCVTHDAIHGSFSKKKNVNKIMGNVINLIGANNKVWRLQHNVLHHSYTNIEDHDDDINAPFFLRFSPHSKKNKLHQFQQYYAWFFYGLSTVSWIIAKDYIRYNRYYKMGLVKNRKTFIKGIFSIIGWKLIYFSFTLIVPMLVLPFNPFIVLLAFISMHFLMGLYLTTVFQAAHVSPKAAFPLPDENGSLESERLVHQLITTCNFSQKSKSFFWLVGGLTNQIEHHLFPHISHVHYKKIAPIVKQTAEEFGLPYHSNGSFLLAVVEHFKMLRDLGKVELQTIPVRKN